MSVLVERIRCDSATWRRWARVRETKRAYASAAGGELRSLKERNICTYADAAVNTSFESYRALLRVGTSTDLRSG